LGLAIARQELPSKCSMRVLKALEDGPRNVPTAQTSEAEIVVMAVSWLKSLLRFAVRCMAHAVVPACVCAEAAKGGSANTAEVERKVMVRRSLRVKCFTEGLPRETSASVARIDISGAIRHTNEIACRLAAGSVLALVRTSTSS
jgi:hypothetical protein